MEYTVKDVAKITGITVRALHWYDKIDLLKPYNKTESNYRIYNEKSLEKLHQILFFRELGFELKDIKTILESEQYNEKETLAKQLDLLIIKKERIQGIIILINSKLKGENKMSFDEFDNSKYERVINEYKEEVRNLWGNTNAYKESIKKTKKYTKEDYEKINAEDEKIYLEFANNMDKSAKDSVVQELVKKKQDHIIKYFYNCTDEILEGLGEMYVSDERFRKNIDKYKVGLSEYINLAIKEYCSNRK